MQIFIFLFEQFIAVIGFFWKMSAKVTKAEQIDQNHEERLKKIEELKMETVIIKLQSDVEYIKMTVDELKKR